MIVSCFVQLDLSRNVFTFALLQRLLRLYVACGFTFKIMIQGNMKILLYIGDKNLKKKTKKLITGSNCRIICKLYYDNYSGPQFLFLIIIVLEIFSSEVDDIFYFVFRKIFFLIRLYFNHDDGKFKKKEKQRTILRQSYRILSRVRCLFVLRLKKYKHIKPP